MILIAGATGYVGGELLKKLLAEGYAVRCLARHPEALRTKGLAGLEVVAGDVLNAESVRAAMDGVTYVYYLVHSMGSTQSFEEQDRRGAQNFARAARDAGVQRIIYLGGLGRSSDQLSAHLRSRHEVGEILRSAGVPVIEFRASVVIGSGSLSFEMIRALVERLPVMIAPRWVSVEAQPIAIADLLSYLLAALHHSIGISGIYEIGGSDRVSYGGLMQEYARQRRLKRLVISVPFLTPRLSSLWLGLVTPLYMRVGRKLIDSIRHSTVVEDSKALREFNVRPCGFREAISAAIDADTTFEMTDSRMIHVTASQADAFAPIRRIGGDRGWYYANWLWRLRGWMDKVVGGVGMNRGRRDPDALCVGDILDCWRVEAFEPDRLLRLVAEMKLPGRAVLEFEVTASASGSAIRQSAFFDARGILGRAYWYSVLPFHHFVFRGMLRGIAANVAMKE
ncbi:MAG: SDR family oxidoreductase [Terracidiphilus sp.]|nr:SDR family oxidoreductase [Terracidiphilus sp.]